MAGTRASAPIAYTDSHGKQFSIPASVVEIDDVTNQIKLDKWKASAGTNIDAAGIEGWATYLARNGVITRETRSEPPPAMVITAKDGGASGNSITVEISNVVTATSKFNAKVTEIDRYLGLKTDTIEAVLGKLPHSGQRPGLVFVASSTIPKAPKAQTDAALTDPNATLKVPVKGPGTGTAFQLQAKGDGDDAKLTTVTITPSADDENTFDLVAKWEKTASGISASQMATEFGYVINVAPLPGRPFGLPAAGKVTLAGGADPGPAGRASAIVPAAS